MNCNRLTKMIAATAILAMTITAPVSAMTTKTFMDTSKWKEVVLNNDDNIYSDNLEKTEMVKVLKSVIPDYAKECINSTDVILFSGSINQIISKNILDSNYSYTDTNAIFGNLKGQLYGEYRENKNEIALDSELRDDIFIITFLHEIGHAVNKQYDVSGQLTDETIEQICEMTGKYSPLNNPDHMDTPNEAAAELFMFCVTQPDLVRDILPDNLMWMIGGNDNG